MSKKTYSVTLHFVMSDEMIVEAENEDEAEEIAVGKIGHKSLCHACSVECGGDLILDATTIRQIEDEKDE